MVLPLLFVPLVYGLSSTPDACAAPNAAPNSAKCRTYADSENPSRIISTCCWTETDAEGIEIEYCQHCDYNPGTGLRYGCGEKHSRGAQQPGVLGDLPTLEQVPTTPPPLFGRNEAAVPPTGGIEQPFAPAPGFQPLTPRPFTSTPFQQIPQGTVQGQDQPFIQSETPPTLSPLPTPPTQTGPTDTPQDNQDDGGLPTIKNQENVPPGGGVAEQPEDDGQEDSSEEAETAGPLT